MILSADQEIGIQEGNLLPTAGQATEAQEAEEGQATEGLDTGILILIIGGTSLLEPELNHFFFTIPTYKANLYKFSLSSKGY